MKIELKLKGFDMVLVLDDATDEEFYEATLIKKQQQGGEVKLGRLAKKELKRVAKAS